MVYEKNAFSIPFLRGYKILKIPIVNSSGESAWPELFSLEKIRELQDTVGARHFSAQMMLEFISPDRVRLDPGELRFYDSEFDVRTAKLCDCLITGYCLYWDPSTGRRNRDSSACVLLYRDDKSHRLFIHDILYLRVSDGEQFPLSNQCEQVLDFMRVRRINRITIETNGIGGGLPEILRGCASKRGANIYVAGVQNSKSKSDRILSAIEPVLSTGHLYAHIRVQQTPFISEMLDWAPMGQGGYHDDGLDAVSGAITQQPTIVRPLGAYIHTFTANTDFKI